MKNESNLIVEEDSINLEKIVELFKQEAKKIDYNSSKEDFKNYEDLKRELYSHLIGEIDKKIDNIPILKSKFCELLFDKIYTSEELDFVTLQEISKLRDDKDNYKWYERKIITSALTLSLIGYKKFDRKKANLLIDFISDFEKDVWQTALTGLVSGLIYHQNKWTRFEDLKTRLQTLKEISNVQAGLNVIDAIFRNSLYDKTVLPSNIYSNKFFDTPSNCFLPFYDSNAVLKKSITNNVTEIDPEAFEKHLANLPFLDCHKYLLCLGLEEGTTRIVKLSKKAQISLQTSANTFHAYNPYYNIICELFHFLTKYPKTKIDDLFVNNLSITKTKLKNLILNKSTELLLSAHSLIDNEEYDQAIVKLEDTLKIEPHNLQALWNLSICHLQSKRPNINIALSNLRKIEDLDPKHWRTLLEIGNCYEKKNNMDLASEYYNKALLIQPTNSKVLVFNSEFYLEAKQWEKAKGFLETGVKLYPKILEFRLNLGNCFDMMDDFENAKTCFENAFNFTEENDFFKIYTQLSALYLKIKDTKNSLNYAELALKSNSTDGHNMMQLGRVHLLLDIDRQLARKFLEKAGRTIKNDVIYGNLGHLELVEGNEAKALEYYKKCVRRFKKERDFDKFDYDLPFLVDLGINKEIYLTIKNNLLAEWSGSNNKKIQLNK